MQLFSSRQTQPLVTQLVCRLISSVLQHANDFHRSQTFICDKIDINPEVQVLKISVYHSLTTKRTEIYRCENQMGSNGSNQGRCDKLQKHREAMRCHALIQVYTRNIQANRSRLRWIILQTRKFVYLLQAFIEKNYFRYGSQVYNFNDDILRNT